MISTKWLSTKWSATKWSASDGQDLETVQWTWTLRTYILNNHEATLKKRFSVSSNRSLFIAWVPTDQVIVSRLVVLLCSRNNTMTYKSRVIKVLVLVYEYNTEFRYPKNLRNNIVALASLESNKKSWLRSSSFGIQGHTRSLFEVIMSAIFVLDSSNYFSTCKLTEISFQTQNSQNDCFPVLLRSSHFPSLTSVQIIVSLKSP